MMYMTITFERDGKVGVYASYDGTSINVSTEANNLQRMLPGVVYDVVIDRMTTMLDVQNIARPRLATGGGR